MFVILGVRYPDTQKVKVKMSYENLSTNTKRSIKIQKRNKPGLSQWEERWRKYSVFLIFRDWVGR